MASSPWLLWLDWLVWGQWQGAGVLFMSSGTQGRVLRGLHGKVETIPVSHLRTQGSGPPWKRASNSEEGGGGQNQAWAAFPGPQLLGDFGRLPKPLRSLFFVLCVTGIVILSAHRLLCCEGSMRSRCKVLTEQMVNSEHPINNKSNILIAQLLS